MGYSTCQGVGIRSFSGPDMRHPETRTCDGCDGCPKCERYPKLTTVRCPVNYCPSYKVCPTCLARLKAEKRDHSACRVASARMHNKESTHA